MSTLTRMAVLTAIFSICTFSICTFSIRAQDFFEWTDENGTVHFTDSMSNVPLKYRPRFREQQKRMEEKRKADREAEARRAQQQETEAPRSPSERTGEAAAGDVSRGKTVLPAGPKQIQVPYKAFEGSAMRVIVSVTINNKITAPMALDTGAPGLVISMELAERLGMLTGDQGRLWVTAGGIGGRIPAIRTIIDSVAVREASEDFIPVTITEKMSDAFQGLVGMDFMSHYSVNIDSRAHVVIFQELPKTGNAPGGKDERWWRANFESFGRARDDWQKYKETLEREMKESRESHGVSVDEARRVLAFAERQYRESEKLFDKLNDYARRHGVPKHWRYY